MYTPNDRCIVDFKRALLYCSGSKKQSSTLALTPVILTYMILRDYFKSTGIVTGGEWHTGQGCQPYEIASCEHHMHSSQHPDCGSLQPTPKCSHECQVRTAHSLQLIPALLVRTAHLLLFIRALLEQLTCHSLYSSHFCSSLTFLSPPLFLGCFQFYAQYSFSAWISVGLIPPFSFIRTLSKMQHRSLKNLHVLSLLVG